MTVKEAELDKVQKQLDVLVKDPNVIDYIRLSKEKRKLAREVEEESQAALEESFFKKATPVLEKILDVSKIKFPLPDCTEIWIVSSSWDKDPNYIQLGFNHPLLAELADLINSVSSEHIYHDNLDICIYKGVGQPCVITVGEQDDYDYPVMGEEIFTIEVDKTSAKYSFKDPDVQYTERWINKK